MKNAMILIALACTISACGVFGPGKIDDTDVKKVLYQQMMEMSQAEGSDKAMIVDVRMPAKYQEGHIPGAINVPLTEIRPQHPQLNNKRPIIVYSSSWADGFSNSAAKKLLLSGYDKDRVYDFRGGLDYWIKEGGRVVSD